MSGGAPPPASIPAGAFLRKPFTVASLAKALAVAIGSTGPDS